VPDLRLILDCLRTRGRTYRYGPSRSQRAELHLPRGPGPHPVMLLIHGGSWRVGYGCVVMRGLAGDLLRRGWAVWNIEYRRLGDGGGWPQTFEDVAAAIDHLAVVDVPLDLDRVSLLGHSAGGHLALWAAGREGLPPSAPGAIEGVARVRLAHVISQAGVCDLAGAYRRWHGGAVQALMGGSPQDLPGRYAVGDPIAHVPLAMPVLLVHGAQDATVSVKLSRGYARAARAAGSEVDLVEIEGSAGAHRAHVDPRGDAWAVVTRWLTSAAERAQGPEPESAAA
jgi:acetyl esterase/lipase